MKLIKAAMWDRVQHIFRAYYDRMMHTCFYYEATLDIAALKEAFTILVTKIPILRSKYVANPIIPYWKVTEHVNADNFFAFAEVDNAEAAADKFLNTSIPIKSDYQLRVFVARSGGKDILAILVNHMCFDGADFKYFNIKLAECYNNIVLKNIHTVDVKAGIRSASQVYASMNEEDRAVAKKLYRNASAIKDSASFPFEPPCDKDVQMIVRRCFSAANFKKLKAAGKAQGATLNDVILAAYYRAFYSAAGRAESLPLSIACMIDLRRHIKSGATAGLTNMTSFFMCRIPYLGKNIIETVGFVKEALKDVKKDKFIGLSGPPLLNLAFTIFPSALAEALIRIGYNNPLLGMSNIGIIEDEIHTLGGVKLSDAYMTGATKFKPYIQLAFTTFRDEITFSVAVKASNADRFRIEKFLESVETELVEYINNPIGG